MKQTIRTVPVAELKAKLSEYLRRVRRGDEVLVTDRGQPVARLTAVSSLSGAGSLVRDGIARPPRSKLPSDFLSRARAKDPGGRLVEIALEERAEDR